MSRHTSLGMCSWRSGAHVRARAKASAIELGEQSLALLFLASVRDLIDQVREVLSGRSRRWSAIWVWRCSGRARNREVCAGRGAAVAEVTVSGEFGVQLGFGSSMCAGSIRNQLPVEWHEQSAHDRGPPIDKTRSMVFANGSGSDAEHRS